MKTVVKKPLTPARNKTIVNKLETIKKNSVSSTFLDEREHSAFQNKIKRFIKGSRISKQLAPKFDTLNVKNRQDGKIYPKQGAAKVLQRIVADSFNNLYAPSAWINTDIDDRTEKIRDILDNTDKMPLKKELLNNISNLADINVSTIVEYNNRAGMADKLIQDSNGAFSLPKKQNKRRQLRSQLKNALPELNAVTYPSSPGEVTIHSLNRKLITSPNHLVKAPDDLDGGYDVTKVCALIAIYKSQSNKAKLNEVLGLDANLSSDSAYYKALHKFYYETKQIQYDEPVTHPALFAEWGFKMIHAGRTTWSNLHNVLTSTLVTGKKYIFDLDNHSVYVTMKKNYHPGIGRGEENFSAYFNFHSDPSNFNTGELNQKVDYIYEI